MTMEQMEDRATDLPEGTETQEEAGAKLKSDLDAQVKVLAAANEKLTNDLKSLRGLRMTEAQREDRQARIEENLDTLGRQMSVLVKALGENTADELPAEVARIQADAQQRGANRTFEAQCRALADDLQEAVQDPDGNVIFDMTTAPELAEARETWTKAYRDAEAGRITHLEYLAQYAKTISQANKATKAELRKRERAEVEKAKKSPKKTEKPDDDGPDMDLDAGPSASGGQGSYADVLKKGGPLPSAAEIDRMTARYSRM